MSDNADRATSGTNSGDSAAVSLCHSTLKDHELPSIKALVETGETTGKATRGPKHRKRIGQKAGKAISDESSDSPSPEEDRQMREVALLWSSKGLHAAKARVSRQELARIRKDLSKSLYELKSLFARNGRGGRWAPYLRSVGISLSTGDRYVQKWALSLAAPENLLTEQVSAPTTETIHELVVKLRPKLIRVLTTQEAIAEFMAALAASLGRQVDRVPPRGGHSPGNYRPRREEVGAYLGAPAGKTPH